MKRLRESSSVPPEEVLPGIKRAKEFSILGIHGAVNVRRPT
jgi:hypothetical protein